MKAQTIARVPVELLPSDDSQRCLVLEAYFRDLLPTASLKRDYWEILLERPNGAEVYVDPNLSVGLDWWGDLQISEIHSAYKRRRGFLLSLHDCWSLLSWTEWMQKKIRQNGIAPTKVTVLHVDDHTDLMNPLLLDSGIHLEDMITSHFVRLDQSESVTSAIQSGAIGVGSFIAPFLHKFNDVTFLHLIQPNAKHVSDVSKNLHATHTADSLLRPNGQRPSLKLSDEAPMVGSDRCLGRYIKGRSLVELLAHHGSGPILLHIDMDCFNNRFDGDSDWRQHKARHDPSTSEVLTAVESFFDCLASSAVASDVEDVAIGLSPGFFPAELWKPSISLVEQCLTSSSSQFSIEYSEEQ